MTRVVIVGGGFAGLYAAKNLGMQPFAVTVLDRRNFHLFQPLLYQVATGALSPGEVASPLRYVLSRQRNTQVLLAEVTDFDVVNRRGAMYHVCALAPNQLAITSKEPMNPGWLTEFRFGGDAVEIMVNVVTCSPRAGGDFMVVLQPFALGGDGKKVWLELQQRTREQPRVAV